jgi:hypothetical protein
MKVRPTLPLVVFVALLASFPTPRPARAQQPGPAAPAAGGPYHALVIGNSGYDSLPKLSTAARDARAIERMLREYYGFRTTLLVNATRSQIVTALSDYRRRLGADASLLVYYAGHGHRDAEAGKAYWLPSDATREDVSDWVSADEITAAARATPARHVLVVSDSCYSGALPHGLGVSPARPSEREQFLRKMAAGRSRTLIASGGDEPSADDADGGHSVFAAALLRGLRMTAGPRFTAAELFGDHILNPVAGRSGRIPAYNPLRDSGHEGGDFVFTRIKPAPVPGTCDDLVGKERLYRTFLDNFKGNAEAQKAAHGAGQEYIARDERCPEESDKNVVGFVRNWVGKYEKALREYERYRRERERP